MASVVSQGPCPKCSSSDAYTTYDDGTSHCFSCRYHPRSEKGREIPEFIEHEPVDILARKLNKRTCEKWGYGVGQYCGQTVQVADYYSPDGRNLVAQKVRTKDKKFSFIGKMEDAGLYGQHIWRDGGKMLVVTEGEIDALSVSQLQDLKWAVVSVPNGAQGAKKALLRQAEWLNKFESVVLLFDNDEPGKAAAHECVDILEPGKIKIGTLALKDANEHLKAGRGKEVIDAIWGAKVIRPDGIVGADELWSKMSSPVPSGVGYPYSFLNKFYKGLRKREIVTICAGSGIGKSSIVTDLMYHFLMSEGEKVGALLLEESTTDTGWKLIGRHLGERDLRLGGFEPNQKKYKDANTEVLCNGRLYLYDHFGSTETDNILSKVRYMNKAFGCTTIFIDHLSIIVSGLEEGDERRIIDNLMTKLRSLAEELEIRLVLVSHLKRPNGTSHEEGAPTSLAQLRGSGSIGQLSDVVIGLERNQQDEALKHYTMFRSLKNRPTGATGLMGCVLYDEATGLLSESDLPGETLQESKALGAFNV